MSDDNKPPEGGDNKPEGDVAELTKQLETLKAERDKAAAEAAAERAEREKLESIRKELEETRQKAKEREKTALEEQGQFKELYEKALAELDEMRPRLAELEPIKDEYEKTLAELKAKEDAEKSAILETIPEGEERDKWKDAPIDMLRKVAPLYAKPGTIPPVKSPPSKSYAPNKVDFSEMTEAEQVKYAAEHNMTTQEIVDARLRARRKR